MNSLIQALKKVHAAAFGNDETASHSAVPYRHLIADPLEPRVLFSATPVAEVESNDTLATAQDLTADVSVEEDAAVVGSKAAPHVSVEGTGDGTFDYYSIHAEAGNQIVADIDAANFDTELFLYDAGGNLIASNDDFLEPGHTGDDLSSFLGAKVNATGTYIIGVGKFSSQGDPGGITGDAPEVGDSYTLHLSIYPQAPTTTAVIDGSGNLVITDTGGDSTDDYITIASDSFAGTTLISDFTNGFFASFSTAAITGDIIVNTLGGDDVLRYEYSGVGPNVIFNGGNGGNDSLIIAEDALGTTVTDAVFNFTTELNGDIDLDGTTITYTGLEPITSSITATDVVLNFNSINGTERITVDDAGGGSTIIDSNAGESLSFTNPTDSLTINTGAGFDDLFVNSFGAGFAAELTIDTGATDRDFIRFNADLTLAADNDLTLIAEQILMFGSSIETTGTGSISITAGSGGLGTGIDLRDVDLTASGTGTITLDGEGSISFTRADVSNGIRGHDGVRLSNGSTVSTANGDIQILGTGGHILTPPGINRGVALFHGSSLSAGGTGNLTITAQSGNPNGPPTLTHADGVYFGTNTSASVVDGDLTITGTAGGNGAFSTGVELAAGASFTSTGGGNINVTGHGSNIPANTQIRNSGIALSRATISTAAGTGSITLNGTGNDGHSYNYGIELASGSTVVSGGNGNIDIDGVGGGSAAGHHNAGVLIAGGSSVTSAGSGALNIDGTGGSGRFNNDGIALSGSTLTVTDGDMIVNGTGQGAGAGFSNRGIFATSSDLVSNGAGSIDISGATNGPKLGNSGIELSGTDIDTTAGTGSIALAGVGSSNGTTLNVGVKLTNSDIATGGNGSVDIDGTGGGTGAGLLNAGVLVQIGSSVSASGTGTVSIDGTGGSGTLLNRGVYIGIGGASVSSSAGSVAVTGTGNGTLSLNRGVEIASGGTVTSTSGDVSITGTGSGSASGVFNTGVYLLGSTASSGSGALSITGDGGTGSTLNEGIRIQSSSVTSTGTTTLTGTANAGTTGLLNGGVYIFLNSTVNGGGGSSITGIGGGGTNLNHGVVMNLGITSNIADGSITGTAGTGPLSSDRYGNFFP